MVVHSSKSAREIELIGEPQEIADLLDGQLRGVEQLHSSLHAQVIEITPRRVTRQAPKQGRIMGP